MSLSLTASNSSLAARVLLLQSRAARELHKLKSAGIHPDAIEADAVADSIFDADDNHRALERGVSTLYQRELEMDRFHADPDDNPEAYSYDKG